MKLPIRTFGQRDPLWADKKLGTSTTVTIGQMGCLLTCHAILLSYYGHDFHPDDLNEFYKTRGVFDQATLINFYRAGECFPDFKAEEYVNSYDVPAPLDKIDKYLAEGKPVIALVDFSPAAGVQTHFVVIYGKDNDYLIFDPWYNETYYFTAKYGDPATKIFGLRLYSGQVPQGGDTLESLNAKITELSQKLSDEIQANAGLRTTNIELQANLKKQEEDNQSLLADNRQAEIDKQNALNKVSGLTAQYHEAEKALQDALKALEASQASEIKNLDTTELWKEIIRRLLRR